MANFKAPSVNGASLDSFLMANWTIYSNQVPNPIAAAEMIWGLLATESQSDRHPRVLSMRVGEIFWCLISINSPTRFARRGIIKMLKNIISASEQCPKCRFTLRNALHFVYFFFYFLIFFKFFALHFVYFLPVFVSTMLRNNNGSKQTGPGSRVAWQSSKIAIMR